MFALPWDVEEVQRLDKNRRKLAVNCECLKDKISRPCYDVVMYNFHKQLCCFKDNTLKYASSVIKYCRIAATHVLVVMISPETRNRKPYAIPVQCVSYASLANEEVHSLCDKLIREKNNRGMKIAGIKPLYTFVLQSLHVCTYFIAGFSTNREWNNLWSKGRRLLFHHGDSQPSSKDVSVSRNSKTYWHDYSDRYVKLLLSSDCALILCLTQLHQVDQSSY